MDVVQISETSETREEHRLSTSSKPNATWEHEDLAQVRIRVLRGHKDTVNSCEFFSDDSRILTSSYDQTVSVWDFMTGDCIQTYKSHKKRLSCAKISQVSKRIVTGGWDKEIHVLDLETGEILWTGRHQGIVTACNFSHDGRLIISGSDLDHLVVIWDAETGTKLFEKSNLHSNTITSCQFTPSDDRIMTTSMDRSTKIWDRNSASTTITLNGHSNVVASAAISNDERKVATVSWDKSIALWDISTGMYRSQGPGKIEKSHEGSVSCCQFSEDGTQLVTGGYDHTIALWDTDNITQKLRLQGHTDWVEDVAYSKDMKWLVSASKDKTVRLWNVEETDKIPVVLENKKGIGHKVVTCASCGKPFSGTQMDLSGDTNTVQCVFCRLQGPEKGAIEFEP